MIRSRLRNYAKGFVEQYFPGMTIERAQKWVLINRTIYFFSATTLGLLIYKSFEEWNETNKGLGQDELDEQSRPSGKRIVQVYEPGKGWTIKEEEGAEADPSGVGSLTPSRAK